MVFLLSVCYCEWYCFCFSGRLFVGTLELFYMWFHVILYKEGLPDLILSYSYALSFSWLMALAKTATVRLIHLSYCDSLYFIYFCSGLFFYCDCFVYSVIWVALLGCLFAIFLYFWYSFLLLWTPSYMILHFLKLYRLL